MRRRESQRMKMLKWRPHLPRRPNPAHPSVLYKTSHRFLPTKPNLLLQQRRRNLRILSLMRPSYQLQRGLLVLKLFQQSRMPCGWAQERCHQRRPRRYRNLRHVRGRAASGRRHQVTVPGLMRNSCSLVRRVFCTVGAPGKILHP